MGVPSRPVSKVRTTSRVVAPLLSGRRVRSDGLIDRSLADGPSPRASLPWHSAHSPFTYALAPRAIASAVAGGADGIATTLGEGVAVKRGDRLFTNAITACTSPSLR